MHDPPPVTFGPHQTPCFGFSPAVTECTTGDHRLTGSDGYGVGFFGAQRYVGTLQSRTIHAGGVDVFECDYAVVANQWYTQATCRSYGPIAPREGWITHECASYEHGTTTPGGLGSWICVFQH